MRAYVSYAYVGRITNGYGRTIADFKSEKPTKDEMFQLESKMKAEFNTEGVIILGVIPIEED